MSQSDPNPAAVPGAEENGGPGYDCSSATSYERLRVIYTERMDYPNAIRVCYAYLLASRNSAEAEQFQAHLQHLLARPTIKHEGSMSRRTADSF